MYSWANMYKSTPLSAMIRFFPTQLTPTKNYLQPRVWRFDRDEEPHTKAIDSVGKGYKGIQYY